MGVQDSAALLKVCAVFVSVPYTALAYAATAWRNIAAAQHHGAVPRQNGVGSQALLNNSTAV
eukprot:7805706-Alexandrium_andersonii.AAC.1